MELNDNYFTPIGIIILIIVLILQPIANKFDISWLKKSNNKLKRRLYPHEIELLKNNSFYTDVEKFKTRTLRDIYTDSKKGTAQKLLIWLAFRYITIMEQDTKNEISLFISTTQRSKSDVITTLEKLILSIQKNFHTNIQSHIPDSIYTKFTKFIDDNSNWMYETINDNLNTRNDSYFDELDKYLYTQSILLKVLKKALIDNIDNFNGEIDALVNKYGRDKIYKLFLDIYFLDD